MPKKIHYKFNSAILPEIGYINIMEAIEEAQRNFLRAKRKGETITLSGKGQSKISSKRWKK